MIVFSKYPYLCPDSISTYTSFSWFDADINTSALFYVLLISLVSTSNFSSSSSLNRIFIKCCGNANLYSILRIFEYLSLANMCWNCSIIVLTVLQVHLCRNYRMSCSRLSVYSLHDFNYDSSRYYNSSFSTCTSINSRVCLYAVYSSYVTSCLSCSFSSVRCVHRCSNSTVRAYGFDVWNSFPSLTITCSIGSSEMFKWSIWNEIINSFWMPPWVLCE